ncbi:MULTISPECIES: hypothetical protein [unclassified Thiocapsa]|uniref:hypothetical protein n=1 Tax=unclassified Thiocapsa TaxID=2641286 RepID=UPI0035B0EBF2
MTPGPRGEVLDLLAQPESRGNYNAWFGNADQSAIDLTRMTVSEANSGNLYAKGVGCAEPCEAQPTVGASCASYRQHNLRVWKFAEIARASIKKTVSTKPTSITVS